MTRSIAPPSHGGVSSGPPKAYFRSFHRSSRRPSAAHLARRVARDAPAKPWRPSGAPKVILRLARHPLGQGGTMKLLFFDDFKLGVLNGDAVVDVSQAVKDIPHLGPQDIINGVITRWAEYRPKLEQAAKA